MKDQLGLVEMKVLKKRHLERSPVIQSVAKNLLGRLTPNVWYEKSELKNKKNHQI